MSMIQLSELELLLVSGGLPRTGTQGGSQVAATQVDVDELEGSNNHTVDDDDDGDVLDDNK